MRTKFRLSAIIATVVALFMLVSGPVASADGGKGKKLLRLTAVELQSRFVDLPPTGETPSLGDELVFSETLFKNGLEVGRSGGVCTVVWVGPYDDLTLHCVATLSLRGGQITLQGLVEVQGMEDPGPFTVAITGGTGKYKCACGQATVRFTDETTAVYRLKIKDCCKDKNHKHKKHKKHNGR